MFLKKTFKKPSHQIAIIAFSLLNFFDITTAFSKEPVNIEDKKKTLKQINSKITKIKKVISQDKSQKQIYSKQLKGYESSSNQLRKKLASTFKLLKKQQYKLNLLEKERQKFINKLTAQQQKLATQLKLAYILIHYHHTTLLSEKDGAKKKRLATYYQYLHKNRFSQINKLNMTLKNTNRKQMSTKKQAIYLKTLEKKQKKAHTSLLNLERKKKEIIKKLNAQINHRGQLLHTLTANENLLRKTIRRLEKENLQKKNDFKIDFSTLKGKLRWPTKGNLKPLFGKSIYQSKLKWNGILIQAKENQPVFSIAPGKVVFSDWMPGYGLLLIINHGHDYMSLYGRNHLLYKKVGDLVTTQDLIATVGKSGGYKTPSLYFEIRHHASPVNPIEWLKK